MQAIARSVLACKPIAARAQSASKQTEVVQAERPETAVVIHQRNVGQGVCNWIGAGLAVGIAFAEPCLATPPQPQVGSCIECIGEVNGGLNACTLASPSCVSTQNDDEAHFVPPWSYNGNTNAAVEDLIQIVTGGQNASNLGQAPAIKLKGSSGATKPACFSAVLESRHKIDDGSEYLHFVFGSAKEKDPDCGNIGVLDAEFIFLANDSVVDMRTASREDPGIRGGNISISLSYGLQYDTNVAKRLMEEVRKALKWEVTPVVTDFDPRFNQKKPLFFEKWYQPFLVNKQDFEDYTVDK